MAGIFRSMLEGMNKARDDAYLAGERDYQQQRRGVNDSREDQSWQDGREDRDYQVNVQRPLQTESAQLGVQSQRFAAGRQPIEARQQDAKFAQGIESGELSNQAARFSVGRMPVEARQRDQQFAVGIQGAQQGNVMRSLQIGSASRAAQIEEAQQPDKLNEIQIERERKAGFEELARVGQQFVLLDQRGEKQKAVDLINQTWAKVTNDPDGDAGVRINEKGVYYLEGPDGQPAMELGGTADQVMQYAFQFLSDPATFAQSRQASYAARAQMQAKQDEARATNPQRFVETMQQPDGTVAMLDRSTGTARSVTDEQTGKPVRGSVDGRSGQMPARLQEVEAVVARMQPQEGESDDDRWMRAYSMVTSRAGLDPDQASADFYETVMRGLLKPDLTGRITPESVQRAQEQAAMLTDEFRGRYLSGQPSSSGSGGQPTRPMAPASAGPQAAPRQQQGRSASGLLGSASPALGAATSLAARAAGSIQGGQQQAPRQAPQRASPYPEGTELQGPDGRTYIVRNGQPVPKQ